MVVRVANIGKCLAGVIPKQIPSFQVLAKHDVVKKLDEGQVHVL